MNERGNPGASCPKAFPAGLREEIVELVRRLALAPDNTDLRLLVAERLGKDGRTQEALEQLRILIRVDPNHLAARKLRDELLRQNRDNQRTVPSVSSTGGALH